VNPDDIRLRIATAADYDPIIAVVDQWWGRPIARSLPRLFLDHFHATSTIAESGAVNDRAGLAGFLIGFLSPSEPDEAYIHFVGVHPDLRGKGLARTLYQRFFAVAAANDRRRVSAITAPQNAGSIAFHTALGFTVSPPIPDYDGEGSAKVLFQRRLPG
jgi:ribosomal protein S18 acetylase RimI-like enzyme